jgi:hypothetical protein
MYSIHHYMSIITRGRPGGKAGQHGGLHVLSATTGCCMCLLLMLLLSLLLVFRRGGAACQDEPAALPALQGSAGPGGEGG